MKQSLKGALLSGLICPGVGQLMLKRIKLGVTLIFVVVVALGAMVSIAVERALMILEEMESMGTIDLAQISNAAHQATTQSDNSVFSLAALAIICCWLLGVIDAYLAGKKADHKNSAV